MTRNRHERRCFRSAFNILNPKEETLWHNL